MKERRRVFTGRVVSNKMQKTVVVLVERTRRHPLYGKVIRVRNRFKAHTENALNIGDTVKITEARPMSKEKRWVVSQVIVKGEVLAVPETELPPTKTELPDAPAAPAAEGAQA
ncbi:MAG: 30S ribosomal protein S17 [Chloroflexi bacterium]|nr:30S ribosomal protein S17 [Chloroflexota bacterium]